MEVPAFPLSGTGLSDFESICFPPVPVLSAPPEDLSPDADPAPPGVPPECTDTAPEIDAGLL
ncbi:MAG: hypothetical protein ACLFQR_08890 [Desulfovibrionales bacterium]